VKKGNGSLSAKLLVSHNLKLGYFFSTLILVTTAVASIAGLLYPNDIYPTDELRRSFLANDVVNLFIGLPILLLSMWLAWRGRLVGLLLWPGAIFYGLYNYLVYLFGMPLNVMFLLYLAVVTLSIYTIIGLVAGIDGEVVKRRLSGRVPERFAGGVLVILGLPFFWRVIVVIVGALLDQVPIPKTELALLVTDFLISPAWVIGGLLLWRRQALGYVSGTGLLFQASMLFIGAIAVLALQPFLVDTPLLLADIIALIVMGAVCFIPFGLFVRGVVKSS
jgi:hypothetical protein